RAFWREIAKGVTSTEAGVAVGASGAAGSRWFREGGGMPSIDPAPLSGRYLSFAEREESAILKVQGVGVREAARRLGRAASPISERLKIEFPDDPSMRISHEAIYQALYVQGRGALKRELVACLRTGRALRVPRARARQRPGGHVTAEVMISQRPAEAADRAVPGHWEGDLIIGLNRSAIGTVA